MRRKLLFALLFLGVLLTDQISKLLVSSSFPYGEPTPVFGRYLMITYVRNPGTVFGLFSTWPEAVLILKAVGLTLLSGVTIYLIVFDGLRKHGIPDSVILKSALVMITASAIANFIDRLRVGAVIDFIDAGIGQHRWYIFNPADAYLVIGAILILVVTVLIRDSDGMDGNVTHK